jgi:hypothetical protein
MPTKRTAYSHMAATTTLAVRMAFTPLLDQTMTNVWKVIACKIIVNGKYKYSGNSSLAQEYSWRRWLRQVEISRLDYIQYLARVNRRDVNHLGPCK